VNGEAISSDPIERALADLTAGKPVVVVDDEDRENEGDLIFAAEKATPELVSFIVRYTAGYICVALTEDECDRLDLPPMHHTDSDSFRTAFTVTVDAKAGITTGISAADRAHTPSGCSPTRRRTRTTSSGPGTCFRCAPAPAAFCAEERPDDLREGARAGRAGEPALPHHQARPHGPRSTPSHSRTRTATGSATSPGRSSTWITWPGWA
jgi:3,4-dihydroxy 2-butanone 4-phosphate synthase/GTP cyclohydrolase II